MSEYKVVERFVSINGEGKRAGELSCFIRFAGCNLNCGYCDTKWANEPDVSYTLLSADELVGFIKECGVLNVTLTGGEPLLQDNISELIQLILDETDCNVEIETNGAVDVRPYVAFGRRLSLTLDYKLPGSGMEEHMLTQNYDYLRNNDTVKFVVSDEYDLETTAEIIRKYRLDERFTVFLSTAFSKIKPSDVVDYMIANRLSRVRLQLQLHKYIWEPDMRGV